MRLSSTGCCLLTSTFVCAGLWAAAPLRAGEPGWTDFGAPRRALDDWSATPAVRATPAAAVISGIASYEDEPCLSDDGWCEEADRCSRGTLFQWSYGTSFSGGPDLDEPIVTDRPDFTEASVTVGRGVVQLEAGYTYVYDNDSNVSVRTHSIGEPLLRVGVLADWLELRLGWSYTDEESRTGTPLGTARQDLSGGEDLYLGAKIALTPQEGLLPEMALVPQMTVPTGGGDRTADEALPGVNWLYGWDLTDELTLAGSTQVNRAIDEGTGRAYAEFAQSITMGRSLTDRLGMYTEWFAFFPHSADTARVEHYVNGGFTFLLSDDVQFDVRGGRGLNDAADDWFAGTGLSVRWK
ncbi:MAG TPA: transporter [Planctomycetaceae bacterium]|nr:transporter [Planctomycetaceae bacterium]